MTAEQLQIIQKLKDENAIMTKTINKLNEENSMLRRKLSDAQKKIDSDVWCNPDHLANAIEEIIQGKTYTND